MDIKEVSDILGLCHFLKAPEHVFLTNEPVTSQVDGKIIKYRGLQPKIKGDSIFLTVDADESSPIHEAIHASLGLGEPGTALLTRVIMRKNRILSNFPAIQNSFKKQLVYEPVESSAEYPRAHLPEYAERVRHFVLKTR